jgi:predicted MFS family arabinose efflux permease
MAFYSLGIPMGMLAGLALGGILADYLGWRLAFVVVGLPGVLLAFVVLFYLKEPRREMSVAVDQSAPQESLFTALRKLLAIPTFRYAALGASLVSLSGMGFASFMGSYYFRNHGAALEDMAASVGLGVFGILGLSLGLTTGITGLIGTFAGGVITDKWKQSGKARAGLLVPALSTCAAFPLFALAFYSSNLIVSLSLLAIASVFFTMWYGPLFASVHGVVPVNARATASAVVLMATNLIGLTLGPVIVGVGSDLLNYKFGMESAEALRLSLVFVAVFIVVAAGMFWKASTHFENDVRH